MSFQEKSLQRSDCGATFVFSAEDQVCTQAKENRISKIAKIQVELGEDSHITEDSLRFCFQLLSEKTIAREAVLEIEPSTGNALTLVSFEGE